MRRLAWQACAMIEYDDGEHVKEVFAYFGRAYYAASCVETGLAMAMLYVDFLAKAREDFRRAGRKTFDRAQYEADFDAFLANQHAQVMGSLIKRVNAATSLSEDLKSKVADANRRRNFLSHHFWRERAVEFSHRRGRDQLIDELNGEAEFFIAVDHQLDTEMLPVRDAIGLSEEVLERHMANFIADAEAYNEP